jgi:hypothetical protein
VDNKKLTINSAWETPPAEYWGKDPFDTERI